jgi:hypothetical protein
MLIRMDGSNGIAVSIAVVDLQMTLAKYHDGSRWLDRKDVSNRNFVIKFCNMQQLLLVMQQVTLIDVAKR